MHILESVLHQFGAVLQVQLVLDVLAVGFDGADTEAKLLGDLPRTAPFADETEDFEFAVGQIINGGAARLHAPAYELVQHAALHFVAQENFPGNDVADGDENFLQRLLFHDVAEAAGAQGPFGVKRLVVHREHEQREIRPAGLDVLDQLQAVAAAQ